MPRNGDRLAAPQAVTRQCTRRPERPREWGSGGGPKKPFLGNVLGGLSGPAIKPIALRAVYQAAQAVKTPIIGIGGIATIDDVMEFFVAGATAVQLGTVNFYNPRASMEVLDALAQALATAGVLRV